MAGLGRSRHPSRRAESVDSLQLHSSLAVSFEADIQMPLKQEISQHRSCEPNATNSKMR